MGGFMLALLGLGFMVKHHLSTLASQQEKVEELQKEISRLSEARVEQATGEARDMIARMEEMDATEGKRWSKLGRMLSLPEPLGITLGRLDLMVRALAKKIGAATPPPSGATQSSLPVMDPGDEDRSMF
jgi:hypothetical protein